MKRPIVLCILDGWGLREEEAHNAIKMARTPYWDQLITCCPNTQLATSGLAVGLPEGQMGNSEVGHMNIGSGRVVMQTLPRIDQAIASGVLAEHPLLITMLSQLKKEGRALHLMGLVSDGGVHAHQHHMVFLAKLADKMGVKTWIHAFLDGRDTPPSSAGHYITQLQAALSDCQQVYIATLTGRYYAMDRDHRWGRVERAYRAVVEAKGHPMIAAFEAITLAYEKNITDEFIEPCVASNYSGVQEGDAFIMCNFRADRAREIVTAFVDPDFSAFIRQQPLWSYAIGMVEYSETLSQYMQTLFASEILQAILGEVVADCGLKQLRIAETEKYAHVTFFFNGGREAMFPGEERILVPSPQVATYDLQPEMAAVQVTDRLVSAIESGKFDMIVVNYANTDMVGHTGNIRATIQAVEAVDRCLGRLIQVVRQKQGVLLVTADHGNAEKMMDDVTGQAHTAHTTGPVPLVLFGGQEGVKLKSGRLCDIAPTMLALMQVDQPSAMTGESLLV